MVSDIQDQLEAQAATLKRIESMTRLIFIPVALLLLFCVLLDGWRKIGIVLEPLGLKVPSWVSGKEEREDDHASDQS